MTDITAISPREVYTFKYTPEDLSAIYQKNKNAYIAPLLLLLVVAALLLLTYAAEAVVITCVLFILVFAGIPYLKGYIKYKKAWPATYNKLLASVYTYEIYDTYFNLSITRNEEVIRTSKLYYNELDKLQIVGNHLHIIHSNQLFVLRRSDLSETSVFYELMHSPKSEPAQPKVPAPTSADKLNTVSWILFIGSFVVLFIAGFVFPAFFTSNMIWLFAILALVPLASIVFGIVINSKGLKGSKNIIIGIVMVVLLAIMFYAFYIPFHSYDDSTDPDLNNTAISSAEQLLGIDLLYPENMSTYKSDEETSCSHAHYHSYVNLSAEGAAAMDEHIAGSSYWVSYIDLAEIAPNYNEYVFNKTFLMYNTDTGEYNTLPAENGTYHFIGLVYSPESAALTIIEYDVEYIK